jgi:hypothetical protein
MGTCQDEQSCVCNRAPFKGGPLQRAQMRAVGAFWQGNDDIPECHAVRRSLMAMPRSISGSRIEHISILPCSHRYLDFVRILKRNRFLLNQRALDLTFSSDFRGAFLVSHGVASAALLHTIQEAVA